MMQKYALPRRPNSSSLTSSPSSSSTNVEQYMPLPDREEMAFSDDSVPHDDSESPYRREFTRYKLDTSTVVERSLENEFLHVLSIIHRYARTHAIKVEVKIE
jgi:hypothetical protein